ncbi:hypothetical protein F4780DRAFT_176223 [Xylariomycetidae sp. FL0641]|nr:hypothetical protein F4780DRAFT_176223 [Xylariomycetidae sp. FL0641]
MDLNVESFHPPGPARDPRCRTRREADNLVEARKMKKFFRHDSNRFIYEKAVGSGMGGVACRVMMRPPWYAPWRKPKRLVVKRASHELGEGKIRNEMHLLRRFRGAKHILQLLHLERRPRRDLAEMPRRTMATEWIENGQLYGFLNKVLDMGHELPNRLLLRIFQCLVHFCIALAWPPDRGHEGVEHPRTERIPRPYRDPSTLVHGDMHFGNILIDDFDPEHLMMPMLKLIDFDLACEAPGDHPLRGVRRNIFDIGKIMLCFMNRTGNFNPPVGLVSGQMKRHGPERTFRSFGADLGVDPQTRFPNLDARISLLVMWCLAESPADRPDLRELHEDVEWLVRHRTRNSYANMPAKGKNESDREIGYIVQQLVLDAPAE